MEWWHWIITAAIGWLCYRWGRGVGYGRGCESMLKDLAAMGTALKIAETDNNEDHPA